jgi:hypothetical protein
MLNKIAQLIQPKPKKKLDYSFLVYKLAKLHGASEYDVFQRSGQNFTRFMIDNAFKSYMNDGSIPWWVKQHLEENLEQINQHSLPYAVQCIIR